MQNFFTKTRAAIQSHKKTSIAACILLLIAVYFIYAKSTSATGETTYTFGTVQTGTIVSSITGTGQVSAGRTINLVPQASGTITYVAVTPGQTVHQGQLIASLDATIAQKAVRDAEAGLKSAQIALEKAQEPADTLTKLQAQDAVTQAKSDLAQSYQDGFNSVSSSFLDFPSIVTGLDQTLHNTDVNAGTNGQPNLSFYQDAASKYETADTFGKATSYAADAEAKYQTAKQAYDKNFADYKSTDRTANTTDIQSLLDETYATAQAIADAVKSANTLIQYYQDKVTQANETLAPKSTTYLTNLSGYTGKINGDVSTLINAKTTITNDTSSLPEKQASLDKIVAGTDPLDIESAQLSLTRAQNSLQDAEDTLANYSVYAPFSGTISSVPLKVGDPSGTIATLITNDQVVIIPLNEVDVSKVTLGDKVTLTFDAISNLTLTGKVAQIDTVGTVSQGVVNYNVTIAFDTINAEVKPGMSTTASIITEVHSDVLTVPSSAVKNSQSGSYVQEFPGATGTSIVTKTAPVQVPVVIGISDDTNTEITSGLSEGDTVVVKSAAVTAAKPTTSAASATSLLGGGATGRTASRAVGGGTAALGAGR